VFCCNDQLADALIRWCRDHQLAQPPVVGFDDAPVAERLNLTTISIPWDELIDGVARVVKRRLGGDRSASSQQIFNPRPVIRSFGLPAPHAGAI
jgi:DNA-binding LacI/PurR family transcriptional regulator